MNIINIIIIILIHRTVVHVCTISVNLEGCEAGAVERVK